MAGQDASVQFRLSARGYADLLRAEANIPFIYDDLRTGPLRPLNAYEEANGTPTIGIGVAIQGEAARQQFARYLGQKIPPDELEKINRIKLNEFESSLNRKLVGAKLSQAMFDALFSLSWNTGQNSASVIRATDAIKRGDYAAAQQAIATGPITSKGRVLDTLVRRRATEAARFAEEGLDNFRDLAETAMASVSKAKQNPIFFALGISLIAGTTFLFTRYVLR